MSVFQRLFLALCVAAFGVALLGVSAEAAVFHSRESALQTAFPGADRIEPTHLYLSDQDAAWIAAQSGAQFEERVVTAYAAYKGQTLLGHAFIDSHRVRTLNETVLIVVSPDARVTRTLTLAFHEPAEYQANERWLQGFVGRTLDPELAIGRGVDSISGASMTSRALTTAHRRVLALHARKLAPEAGTH